MTTEKETPAQPVDRRRTRVGPRKILLKDLIPHPLNANRMSDEMRQKLKINIKRTGRYPYLIVRPHPEQADKYQVLDGHHRIAVSVSYTHMTLPTN